MAKKKYGYWARKFKLCRHDWSRNSSVRKQCLANAKVQVDGIDKWTCNVCQNSFAQSEIACDHKDPISNTVPQNLEEFITCVSKTEVPLDMLQIICRHNCHKLKTRHETFERNKKINIKEIASFMGVNEEFIENHIQEIKVLKQLVRIIHKINNSENKVAYNDKFNKITKKYL